MAKASSIEWTDATFNPWWGCSKVSPACDHCYAERDAGRFAGGKTLWGVGAERRTFADKHWQEPKQWAKSLPVKLGRRPRVFCASMADVFDKEAPEGARERLWQLIKETPELDWLLLTKRIGNAMRMLPADWGEGYPNVWLGASIATQPEADRDVARLCATPARVRFLSIEPLLGPVKLRLARLAQRQAVDGGADRGAEPRVRPMVDWVIVGGESGPQARPMHPDWARSLRDECRDAGVAMLFKQWGEWLPRGPESLGYPVIENVPRVRLTDRGESGSDLAARGGNDVWMQRAGRKAAGRLLDGVLHDGYPLVPAGGASTPLEDAVRGLRSSLLEARQRLALDRQSLVESHSNASGKLDADAKPFVREYDTALARIDRELARTARFGQADQAPAATASL